MNKDNELSDLKTAVSLADLIDLPLRNGKASCPFHTDHTPSFVVYSDHYHCYGCRAHGDHFDWLTKHEGLTFAQAVEHMRALAGRPQRKRPPEKKDPAENREYALKIWNEARPIIGTLAEAYLTTTRGIDLTGIPSEDLRFHPRCPFTPGMRHPCLVALFRNPVTNEPTGIHRTALTADAKKIERLSLGPTRGSVIKLWADEDVSYGLVLGEGIETTLAAATRAEHHGTLLQPAWAAGKRTNMASFPVLAGIDALTVLVDNDANGASLKAASEVIWRWRDAGREAIALLPDKVDSDFNDLVRERAS
jgi:hypothetical protein